MWLPVVDGRPVDQGNSRNPGRMLCLSWRLHDYYSRDDVVWRWPVKKPQLPKPLPVYLAWFVASVLALVVVAGVGFGLAWFAWSVTDALLQ